MTERQKGLPWVCWMSVGPWAVRTAVHWADGLAAWWADAKAGQMAEKRAATSVEPTAVCWAARRVGTLGIPMAVLLVAQSGWSVERWAGKLAAWMAAC